MPPCRAVTLQLYMPLSPLYLYMYVYTCINIYICIIFNLFGLITPYCNLYTACFLLIKDV